jgi:hypothetical protein
MGPMKHHRRSCLAAIASAALLTAGQAHAARHRNLNVNFDSNAEHCSDMKVTSDGEIARADQVFTMSKAEAPILEMSGIERGVFQVRGWDRAEYSVEACKLVAADDRATAEAALRGISVNRTAGRISSTGPSNDNANWEVYFIVRAPRDANLDLETRNGPISVAGVNGSIKVRATNGPVSLRDCAGMQEVHTQNGPISFRGNGGEVRLDAHNGPISLDLAGDVWNGSVLEAKTVNGPVSIAIPDAFRSGVRVETSGHSPVSCAVGACKSAWSDGQHILQLNGSSDTIRVSTNNGPVSVHTPREHGTRIM